MNSRVPGAKLTYDIKQEWETFKAKVKLKQQFSSVHNFFEDVVRIKFKMSNHISQFQHLIRVFVLFPTLCIICLSIFFLN